MALYLGCPMWGLKAWVGNFFPKGTKPKDFLATYSRRLNAVEGNTTFYALPDADTIARWRDATPAGFKFCLKVPQSISHYKRLRHCQADTAAFADRLRLLGERRGPAFLQLPPSFDAAHLDALGAWLAAWPADLQLAVEPRHTDFFGIAEADFDALLRQYGAARCTFDTVPLFSAQASSPEVAEAQARKPRLPTRATRTAAFAFVRYVGHPDLATNRAWLAEWASRVVDWLAGDEDVYFFCHHPDDTYAPALARLFYGLVGERLRALPPLPDWGGGNPADQPGLFSG